MNSWPLKKRNSKKIEKKAPPKLCLIAHAAGYYAQAKEKYARLCAYRQNTIALKASCKERKRRKEIHLVSSISSPSAPRRYQWSTDKSACLFLNLDILVIRLFFSRRRRSPPVAAQLLQHRKRRVNKSAQRWAVARMYFIKLRTRRTGLARERVHRFWRCHPHICACIYLLLRVAQTCRKEMARGAELLLLLPAGHLLKKKKKKSRSRQEPIGGETLSFRE